MELVVDCIRFVLYLSPLCFFVLSYLHFKGKIKPSLQYGYSAKGQFVFGLAFVFGVIGIGLRPSVGALECVVVYVVLIFVGVFIEGKEKVRLNYK